MTLSRKTLFIVLFVLSAATHIRAQQSSVVWIDDGEAGVAAAQKSSLPILFLILPPSDKPSATADKSKESFNDAAVIRLVSRRFIAVHLERSNAADVLLKRLDAPNVLDGSAVIATPGGGGVDIIATDDVQDAQRLAKRLAEAFGKYQAKVLADSVAPTLGNRDAKPKALLESLRLVKKLELSEADKAIAKLLDRKKLAAAVRSAAYDTLAALSTERAVAELLDAALQDMKAVDALRLCTPAGAAALLSALKLDDRERLVLAYDTLIAICSIGEAKPAEFWQGGNETSQEAEIDRIKVRIATCVQSWRESRDHRG